MLTTRQKAIGLSAVAAGAVMLALLVVEIALRISGFEFRPFPVVQFGWPDARAISVGYQSDPDLLWVTRHYRETLDAARREPPAVVFMGDSCTEFGTYPSKTLALLAHERPALGRGVKVGVGGWSVVQGSWQLTRDVLPLHPHVITIYYGWNDHWVALGPPDADVRRARVLTWLSDHVRLVQLVMKVRAGFGGPDTSRPNRVDIATYSATLATMVAEIHAANAQAVLITAGSSHRPGAEPAYLKIRHLRRLQDLIPLHQSYVEATRQVAARSGAVLCDAAADFASITGHHPAFFRRDGIHLTDAGDRELARLLARCIETAEDSRARRPVVNAAR
jgi:lysophospholipase L1-like esterase